MVTRAELIAIVRDEYDAGFTYDDAMVTRVVHAIETVNPVDVDNADIEDIEDESTANDAQQVALTIEFHYGHRVELTD